MQAVQALSWLILATPMNCGMYRSMTMDRETAICRGYCI